MRVPRRALLAGLASPLALSCPALAQAPWPSRTIRFIVPFAPGGPVEIPARFIAEQLSPRLGQPVIVEAKPGAGGALGIQSVAQANDPHLMLVTTSAIAILPALMKEPGFDPLADFTPVSLLTDAPMIFLARPDSPVRDLEELLAKARAKPGSISYGSSGAGSTTHLGGALFCSMAGVDLLHVPYRGAAQAVNALYAGDTDLMVTGMGEAMPHLREKRLRAIAVTGRGRIPALPEVPAAMERVPDYVITIWYGFFGPRGLPPGLAERLATEIAPLRDGSALAERFRGTGVELLLTPPASLAERMAREVPQWKRIAAAANLRAE
ncbi:tripartite tricarboxylate transporter substrate binding protein [Siccirubricoccus sp. KC 17139]|uniref:Tripartite tricarboxylate transporter substrate binding protein n=1 Tax=Siccirubricoccus soli TaxID=2899147 RepID=A0ABT1D155_9PROT|nr:tripartite tricarboxylate transporter substrate binding protein [Siccirubricoccus soli]MCO6415641.1 tripartite tricarboxylate transporter substrate binding protein [Siccirubricoccus soli]MCP2681773.1 tripartite tricarboxylate transporter substrate binding protein [Siccirubricoccus soli]